MWGGVIGDDGVDNIVLGPEEPEGQAYLDFQRYIKEYTQLGVILNINSKNDEANALSGLDRNDSELKRNDFISIKANWKSKDKNFVEIANELNLLPESLLFIDDNPAERYIVTKQLPGVIAPDIGEVHNFIQNIDRGGYFEVTAISADDIKRNQMYKEDANRLKLKSSFENYTDYLLSLDMKAEIKPFTPVYIARIAQLINKSNQFNLTTKRYTQSQIGTYMSNDSYITIYGKLTDKFGDSGVVSIIIGNVKNCECHIDLWVMSCRVLKRDMEFAMMDALVNYCIKKEITKIFGYYYPTAKNGMVKEFYDILNLR